MSIRDWITENQDEYDTEDAMKLACRDALNVSMDAVSRMVKRMAVDTGAVSGSKGHSLDVFRSKYDHDTIIPAKIEAGLKELGEGWMYETEFSKMASVSQNHLANYRDSYSDYWLVTRVDKRRVWAGTKALATKLKEYC